MQRTASITGLAIAILALAVPAAGCGSTPNGTHAASTSSATTTPPTAQQKVASRRTPPGPNPTIAGYIQQNGITETPVHRGDPGAPIIDLPIPDGWADAGHDKPVTAYWAIVDTGPEAASYTPSIVVTVSKLTGNVDQQKILDLAAGELKNLPGFTPMGDGSSTTLSGFPGYQFGGDWVDKGQSKAVAQKTVVIMAGGGAYLMRLNADCLQDQIDKALPATIDIDEKTKISV